MESLIQTVNNMALRYDTKINGYLSDMRERINNSDKYAPKSEAERIERLQQGINWSNATSGALTGYDCNICRNKGFVYFLKNEQKVSAACKCAEIRNSLNRIERSGLKDLLSEFTFDKYNAALSWQEHIKTKALEFIQSDVCGKWFYIGGQVGCGKTHICTAIVNEFLKQGKSAKYMLWRDEIVSIKSKVNSDEDYFNAVNPLKTTAVLYIDDFFKTEKDTMPTPADVNVAFEIINYRYNNKSLITIISSERVMTGIIDIDEAVGSRIKQRTESFCINIAEDRDKNYRLQ